MSVVYNTGKFTRDGLKFHVDPANTGKMGVSPYKELTGTTTVTNTDFTEVNGVWRSNANTVTGAGTSNLSFSGISVASGSFTMIIWLKVTSNPNVGVNNNWRSVFMVGGSGQSPFGILLEEGRDIQFSLATSVTSYRYLATVFTQYNLTQDLWYQVGFAYDHTLAKGYAYQNGTLVRAGNMATSAGETTKAAPGEGVTAVTSGTSFSISNSNNVTDPSGAGCFPGDIGPAMIYDRALTTAEMLENFNAYRGRYGL
jgi:hypothetical protein